MTDRLFGHCQDAQDCAPYLSTAEVTSLHVACPGTLEPMQHPDPARKGATYTLPGRTCSCACHTRPGTVSAGRNERKIT